MYTKRLTCVTNASSAIRMEDYDASHNSQFGEEILLV